MPPALDYLVFITYFSRDIARAREIERRIRGKAEHLGVTTFLDEKDIAGGDSIRERIRVNLQRCKEQVVLVTPMSVERPWVWIEIGAVWVNQKRIIPILDQGARIPDFLADQKGYDFSELDKYLEELAKRVSRLLEEP